MRNVYHRPTSTPSLVPCSWPSGTRIGASRLFRRGSSMPACRSKASRRRGCWCTRCRVTQSRTRRWTATTWSTRREGFAPPLIVSYFRGPRNRGCTVDPGRVFLCYCHLPAVCHVSHHSALNFVTDDGFGNTIRRWLLAQRPLRLAASSS